MTCSARPDILAMLLLVVALIGLQAWRAVRALSAATRLRTADAARIERETRRLRAGAAPAAKSPDPATTQPRMQQIASMARSCAQIDFRDQRRRVNPFPRHSRDAAVWSLNYVDEWNQLDAPTPGHPWEARA